MSKVVQIIGIPVDLGQSNRGVGLGPGALRNAGLSARLQELGYTVHDSGNLPVPVRESLAHEHPQRNLPSTPMAISTATKRPCQATSTACRWRPCLVTDTLNWST